MTILTTLAMATAITYNATLTTRTTGGNQAKHERAEPQRFIGACEVDDDRNNRDNNLLHFYNYPYNYPEVSNDHIATTITT